MRRDKTPPPKAAIAMNLVAAVVFAGLTVFGVMRGSGWGFPASATTAFVLMAWSSWYQRRKAAESQQPKPEKG